MGSAVLPFGQHAEGSTVFLPFKADLIFSAEVRNDAIQTFLARWERWRWSERERTQLFQIARSMANSFSGFRERSWAKRR